jgi:prepilin-type N-terminal cleavage/methylation domain-containing protein
MKNTEYVKKGFTLVELMVVVGLIALMATIVLAAIGQARENTREKKRVADLSNVEFALTLAKERDRRYPDFASGVEIGVGDAIDNVIRLYNGNIYRDPKSSGTRGGAYAYWYDSDFTCYAEGQTALYIKTVEQSKNANFSEICTHPDAGGEGAGSDSYVVLLGPQSARAGGPPAPAPSEPEPEPEPEPDPYHVSLYSSTCGVLQGGTCWGSSFGSYSCTGAYCKLMCNPGSCVSCIYPTLQAYKDNDPNNRTCTPWP